MSAICGLLRLGGREVHDHEIRAMAQRLAHRGPDGLTMWLQGPVGLGHAMLYSTAESLAERLPLVDESMGLALVGDIWLANRPELAHGLGISNAELATLADSELVLRAFIAYGERCTERLVGDYALCIYVKAEHRVFCARDAMGIKPFYYCYLPESDLFCFGSEIKSLFALPEVPAEIDPMRIAQTLVGIVEEKEGTGFARVKALPAAHAMSVDSSGARVWRHWTWDPETELKLADQREYDEAFRAEFTRAVKASHRSAYPLGAFLSGGLDSSSIVCLTERVRPHDDANKLCTYSAMFDGLPKVYHQVADESAYIRAVLQQTDTTWHPIPVHELSSYDDIDSLLWLTEEPPYGPNLYIHRAIYMAARSDGVRVMLDGVDGDTTVSHGWERLPELFRQGRWLTLTQEIRALARTRGASSRALWWGHVLRPAIPDGAVELYRKIRGTSIPVWGANRLIRPEFAAESGLLDLYARLEQEHAQVRPSARRTHMGSIVSPLYAMLFNMADKTSGASGITTRYPFFDRDLLKFCLSLPADQKLRNGYSRAILRTAMAGVLPEMVAQRHTKGNLGVNLMHQLDTAQRHQIERWAGADGEWISPYVDLDRYRSMLELFQRAPLHHKQEVERLFWASTLGLWIERLRRDPRFEETPALWAKEPTLVAKYI